MGFWPQLLGAQNTQLYGMTLSEQHQLAHAKVILEVKALYDALPALLNRFWNDFAHSFERKMLGSA